MIKKFLSKKAGVTVLEGLIALGLLAMVAAGTFGVLLSVSRKTNSPDVREEMVLAVERAHNLLQMYEFGQNYEEGNTFHEDFQSGLCGNYSIPLPDSSNPEDEYHIECLLPAMCDRNNSSFTYRIVNAPAMNLKPGNEDTEYDSLSPTIKRISFEITCNGFTL